MLPLQKVAGSNGERGKVIFIVFSQTSYSDYAPILLASEASMDLLNSKLEEKLEIERFRPNIIVTGCSAHAEVFFS